jgi:hypothetical protein
VTGNLELRALLLLPLTFPAPDLFDDEGVEHLDRILMRL